MVEIAALPPENADLGMPEWPDGDTVQGWVTADELSRLIDYMAQWPSNPPACFQPHAEWRNGL